MESYSTKDIYVPQDPDYDFDDELGINQYNAACDMADLESKYLLDKLGQNYIWVYDDAHSEKFHCPANCGARTMQLLDKYISSDRTKCVLILNCYRCNTTAWVYQEIDIADPNP